MRKVLILLLLASPSQAALTKFWISNGAYKVAQDDLPPTTTNYNWNLTTAYTFGAKQETVSLVLFIGNDTASDVSQVSVSISSFSKSGGGTGFSSVVVSSMNVWNMTSRPIQQFIVGYLPMQGLSKFGYGADDYYDQYHQPERFRRPCTPYAGGTNGGGCAANGGTLWTDRPDHDKYYPDILEPYENVTASSFTVYSSSSQAVWFDIFIDKTLAAGDYTSTITVKEGVSISTAIPVLLTVKNFTLPDTPSVPTMIYISPSNVFKRHYNDAFPSFPNADPYYTTTKKYMQMLHAHGMTPMGNDNYSSDSPNPIDVARLNGTLYSSTTGYYGRGQDTGDKYFSVGTYGGWQNSWNAGSAKTDDSLFCGHVKNWQDYFKANFPDVSAFLYLHDESLNGGLVEKWATWMSTVTACQTSGYALGRFLTSDYPAIQSGAPHVNMVCAASWLTTSSATWQTSADNYITQGATKAWAYNGNRPYWGTNNIDDDGISPTVHYWAMAKKGVQGYFNWESTYYNDYQAGRTVTDNNLWHDAETFGGNPSYDTILGRNGYLYTNGEGVLMYPGKDAVYTADSRGVDAPYASWRLKMLRRGIQDADYIAMAKVVNATATNAEVATRMPKALWDFQCDSLADCTYMSGIQSWSNDPDVWETSRETLAGLLDGQNPVLPSGPTLFGGGRVFR